MSCVYAEVILPRSIPDYNGIPTISSWKHVTVYVPPGGTVECIRAYIKNEPGGQNQVPAKPDTEDLGSSNYTPYKLDSGESKIGWCGGSLLQAQSQENGGMAINAKFSNWAVRNDRTAKLEVEFVQSDEPEIYSEIALPRSVPGPDGQPMASAWRDVYVHVPPNGSVISVKGYIKNEPAGIYQIPPKVDTDGLDSTEYMECSLTSGTCPIQWATGKKLPTESLPNGGMLVRASFANWFYRNDRMAKLVVTYTKAKVSDKKVEKKSSICALQ